MGAMDGKTVIITGGNSGIGLETGMALAEMGARVVITARDPDRGTRAVQEIKERTGSGAVELVVFDLGSQASTRAGAAEILERCDRIDVLINNAGLVLSERQENVDGLEMTFAVNHLGPFLLTTLLLDRIKASAPARIVNVSSSAHGTPGTIDFDDLQSTKRYSAMAVYGRTKLENILFTNELAKRLDGTGVTANSLHPGTVATGYGRSGDTTGVLAFGIRLAAPFMMSPARGARTSVYLASSPEVEGVTGGYFMKCKPAKTAKFATDEANWARLWEASEALITT